MKITGIITENSVIGHVIVQKGQYAAEMMEKLFCVGYCCPRTGVQLGTAAKMLGKEQELPGLIGKLNGLPDLHP